MYFSNFKEISGVLLCLYVDDIHTFETDIENVKEIKKFSTANFDIKDFGKADVILRSRFHISTWFGTYPITLYIEVLKKFNNDILAPIPLDPSINLVRNKRESQ